LLEELNKELKSWLKMAGVPSDEQWLNVARNIDNLNKVCILFINLVYIFCKINVKISAKENSKKFKSLQ